MDNYLNQTLNSRYTILELLGSGGMATVYKAYDMVDAREVAIKILNGDSLADENMRNRFINEAKAIASVSHPNIVNIYDFYCDESLAYIVMEYVKGISLRDYMKGVGVVEPRDAAHFIVQILRALQHAHDAGIYHRDIKPENILILPNASVKVSDFGIAKLTHGRGIEIDDGRNFGSVRYMSPEQITNGEIDGRSDIYAVGVMFYELVTGRLPFDSANDDEIALMQLNDTPVRPITYNPSIPVGLEQIILHAMQKNPSYRFSSAASFLVDLNEFRKNNTVRFDYAVEQVPVQQNSSEEETQERNEPGGTKPVSNPFVMSLDDETDGEYEDSDDLDDDDDDDDGKNNFIPIIVASVVSVVVIVGIILAVVFGGAIRNTVSGSDDSSSSSFFSKLDVFGLFTGDKLEVPNFLNMDYDQAILEYPDIAIANPPQYEYNSTYEDGKVCAQDPEAGSKVDADTVIKLTVAASGEMILVKDATGMTYQEAQSMFENDGLTVVLIPTKDDEKKEGEVISTSPAANAYVAQSGSVFIYYASSTNSDELVKVPNVTGYGESAAIAKIKAAGLTVGSITRAESTESMKGLVITQSPTSSASVKSGSLVNIIVGTGGLEDETVTGENDASFTIVLPSTDEKGTVTTYLNGKLYKTISGVKLDGTKYGIEFTGKGDDNDFEIYVDGNLIYSGEIDFTTIEPTVDNVQAYQFTSKSTVPDVEGISQKAAVNKLEKAGFERIKVVTKSSDSVPEGQVISQSPDSGTKAASTIAITIVVSSGPEETEAPETEAPETEAPDEPEETEEPDEPEETESPDTEAPETEAPDTVPQTTKAASEDEDFF